MDEMNETDQDQDQDIDEVNDEWGTATERIAGVLEDRVKTLGAACDAALEEFVATVMETPHAQACFQRLRDIDTEVAELEYDLEDACEEAGAWDLFPPQ